MTDTDEGSKTNAPQPSPWSRKEYLMKCLKSLKSLSPGLKTVEEWLETEKMSIDSKDVNRLKVKYTSSGFWKTTTQTIDFTSKKESSKTCLAFSYEKEWNSWVGNILRFVTFSLALGGVLCIINRFLK